MLHSKFSLRLAAVAVAAVCSMHTSQAAVLNFDDLSFFPPPGPPTITEEWFTSLYNGFKFGDLQTATNSWFYSQRPIPGVYQAASGNQFAATDFRVYSGNVLESLAAGQTITNANDFEFVGASFSGLDQIQYQLLNNGVVVHTSGIFNLAEAPAFLASGYAGLIDEINILGTQGFYAMDDFTYNQAAVVPEPSGLALLLAAAGAGLVASRRRKGS